MACNLKLLDYIRGQNPGKVIPAGGMWSWGGGSPEKCGPFSTGSGTDPGALTGDNPCINVKGWAQMYYQFVYDTGRAFHYLVINVKARPNAGCDTKSTICENDNPIDLKDALDCAPDIGGTWYVLNDSGIDGTVNTEAGTYAPAVGDGGNVLRMMYGFGGNQEGQCCKDSCQSAAILEIKVRECGCDDLHVILRRDKNELIADYTGCGNTITPEYRWYKDLVLIDGEIGDSINFVGYGDGDYLVKVICGDCEEQDRFFSGETCAYPEIIGTVIDDNSEPYGVTVDVRHMTGADTIDIKHRTNVTEDGYDEDDISTYTLNGNDLTFDVMPGYGRNVLVITLTNSCGEISETVDFFKDCPSVDPGLTSMITICEGCWGTLPAIDFLDGAPDAGGVWEDVLLSGQLDGDDIHFDQLNEGLWEFRYTVNQDYASCTTSASLFVEVLKEKDSGQNTATNLCHDAGQTDLLSLISGNPEAGGEWYTDDVIDGTLDLENGTITPAATDIGKTITVAYSHTQQTTPLPSGLPPAECWLEFDGVDDYVQARNSSVFDVTTGDFDMEVDFRSSAVVSGSVRLLDKRGQGKFGTQPSYGLSPTSDFGGQTYANSTIETVNGNGGENGDGGAFDKPYSNDGKWHTTRLTWDNSTGTGTLYEDDVQLGQFVNASMIGESITTSRVFTVGAANTSAQYYEGDIRSFRFGTETFPMNEGAGTTITGSEGTVLDIYGATWGCIGVDECDCSTFSLLTITIEDCTPPIPCPDDSGLGIDIVESSNASPADAQWVDLLTITETGAYDDAGVVDTDDLYFSNDDGDTWIQGSEVKDDDYYVKMTSGFDTDCNSSAQTGSHEVINVTLTNGENADEAQLLSRNGNFNNSWTGITPSQELKASGSSSSLISERFFRWDIKHVLNSGWQLAILRTHFDRGNSGSSCPNGVGGFGVHTNSGNVSGKRKILVQRRITYNNGCDPITIEGEFNPTLPDCDPVPSNVGFNITDPYKIGGSEYTGSIQCSGSMAGSTSDVMYVYEQPTGANGYASSSFACGGSDYLYFNYSYFFVRIIQFADCPPVILTRNYGAPTSCTTAQITCTRDNANSRAKAEPVNTPSFLSSQYYQYKRGSGSWQSYSPGQWIYVTGQTTVSFRRIANYNNGCPQTTDQCSTTVSPPTYSLSIGCSNDTIIVSASNMPPGGTYFLYRDGVVVTSNTTGANFNASQNGDYQVRYKYNQYQYINSNIVNCGTSGGGCNPPTVNIGACNIVNGNELQISFSTTEITQISQINASVNPGSGSFNWQPTTGQGTLIVTGTPGQSYDFQVEVTNQCGSDIANRTCQIGCTTLQFDNISCDFNTGKTTYDVLTSPDTGDTPTSNGIYLSKPSNGRYRFQVNQTSGTITANHPVECTGISQSINCQCPTPIVNLNLSCDNNQVSYSFIVSNEGSVSGDYKLKLGSTIYTINNTGAGSYSGNISKTGLSHTYDFYYTACGSTPHDTGTINCSCNEPSISASASCAGTTVSYSFTVTNESQVTSNYTILLNGSAVDTITRTGAGTYNDTLAVGSGSNNTVQIRANSVCGGQRTSNIASANCACPAASLSISNVSCDSGTQMLTFDVNQSNITGLVIKVNGSTITPVSNPQNAQGVSGNNTIEVTGTDSCAGTGLSDTVNYNCGCDQPSIALNASCNTSGLITFDFTVTDEGRMNGNYRVIVNGSAVDTITRTGAGTYNDTWQGVAGTNYTIRVEGDNKCGSTTKSNTVGTSCGCPASSLTIDNVSCNPSNQQITFTVNGSNITNRVIKVNGTVVTVTLGSPKTVQGQIGNNMIVATAEDACTGDPLSASQTLNCLCNNNPTVSLGTPTESGGVITVPISTTNITSAGQINFIGNGSSRTVSGSGNSYTASFPAQTGSNSFSVSVSNNCGNDSDSGSYNYNPCVPPTITKISQGTTFGGGFYVDFQVQNCDSISAPGTSNFVNCQSTRAEWNPGSSTLNWSITVNNGCGSDVISGTYNPCTGCQAQITDLGCTGSPEPLDVLFVIDGSVSFTGMGCNGGGILDFGNALKAVSNTINDLEASSPGIHRYALCEYSEAGSLGPGIHFGYQPQGGNYFLTSGQISSSIDVNNYTRQICGCAQWTPMWLDIINHLGFELVRRSGKKLHVIIIHDSSTHIPGSDACSNICSTVESGNCFYERNLFLNNVSNVEITVVQYDDGGIGTNGKRYSATNATRGGSWTGGEISNPGDPDPGSGLKRHFFFSSPSPSGIPGLVEDIIPECNLEASIASGCSFGASSYSWSTTGGSILSGQGTNRIKTNGAGSYTVTITLTNGCQVQKTYNY